MSFLKQNLPSFYLFSFFLLGFFIVDRFIKSAVLEGFLHDGSCISFVFVLNQGVAFSWFAFLGDHLKWIQVGLLAVIFVYVVYDKLLQKYPLALSLIFAGGVSNVYDRFVHGGVVDFIYWHCGFDFAIFNFADVIINVGVALLLLLIYLEERAEKSLKKG